MFHIKIQILFFSTVFINPDIYIKIQSLQNVFKHVSGFSHSKRVFFVDCVNRS